MMNEEDETNDLLQLIPIKVKPVNVWSGQCEVTCEGRARPDVATNQSKSGKNNIFFEK
jgi:hypothetical protein